MDGETCLGKQQDGSCQAIFIPDCVDRNVYCSNVPTPTESTKSITVPAASNGLSTVGTSFSFVCPQNNFFFDYSLPKNLTSYYYSNNINTSTVTCNIYGLERLILIIFITRLGST